MRFQLDQTSGLTLTRSPDVYGLNRLPPLSAPGTRTITGASFLDTGGSIATPFLGVLNEARVETPDPGVPIFEADDAIIAGRRFVVFDRRTMVLNSFNSDQQPRLSPEHDPHLEEDAAGQAFLNQQDNEIDIYKGRYAIAFWEAAVMYHNWLTECMSRIVHVVESPALADVKILLPLKTPRYVKSSLQALAIPEDRIVYYDESRLCCFEKLIIIPAPDQRFDKCSSASFSALRQRALAHLQPPPFQAERILITRRDAKTGDRILLNEPELITAMEAEGFHAIEAGDFSVAEQIALIHNAKLIACIHGSAGANFLFCGPETRVLNIFPECVHYYHGHGILSALAGARYAYVYGPSFSRGIRAHNNPWLIDPSRVISSAKRLGELS